jgi:hypothetical protein
VNVPKLPELAVTNLLADALLDKKLKEYLPDLYVRRADGQIE